MKTKFLILIIISTLMGFSEKPSQSEYSYLLTITSVDDEEHSFNLKITSTDLTKTAAEKIMFENQITPFEQKLEPGEHIIVVDHIGDKGFIISKVVGILNGETMGLAATDDSGARLKAGPGGRCSIDQ
jgi:hypothetical protein